MADLEGCESSNEDQRAEKKNTNADNLTRLVAPRFNDKKYVMSRQTYIFFLILFDNGRRQRV
jgi:hypothetical protein